MIELIVALISAVSAIVGSAVVGYIVVNQFTSKYSGLEKLSDIALEIVDEWNEESQLQFNDMMKSVHALGISASTMNQILNDEELFNAFMTDFVNRFRKSAVSALGGTAKGDSHKRARAEELVNEGTINLMKNLNPALGLALKLSGMEEELKKDPEMVQQVIAVLGERGLLDNIGSESLSMPSSDTQVSSGGY